MSPRKVPTEFPTVLTSTIVILGNPITKEDELLSLHDLTEAQLNVLCSSGRHRSLVCRPCLQRCSQPNFSSGDIYDLTGRSNIYSVLFWEAPQSCLKTLSPEMITEFFCSSGDNYDLTERSNVRSLLF